jgi:hypothetical protein
MIGLCQEWARPGLDDETRLDMTAVASDHRPHAAGETGMRPEI